MPRLLKKFAWIGLLAAGLQGASAFSLIGPFNEPWQVRDVGFNIPERGDQGGPKNFAEEYRRNVPVLYYAFDSSFLTFFGDRGAAEIDKSFAILNSLLSTNVSSWSSNLLEFPLEAKRYNYRAAALNLVDLKSETLSLMLEQLGLADPVRYVWAIHDRSPGAACPIGNQYLVTMRNFGYTPSPLDELQYSSYINGIRYSYFIAEYCANPPFGSGASEAIGIPLEGLLTASRFTPVASFSTLSLSAGSFYFGLTRDDVAGLRYLYNDRNANWEEVPAGSQVFATNSSPPQLVTTSNLTQLAQQALVTDPVTLQALYPNLVITSSSNFFTTVWVTNLGGFFTNSPFDPIGSPPRLVLTTNASLTITQLWHHTFGNVELVQYTNGHWQSVLVSDLQSLTNRDVVTSQTITVSASADPFAPANTLTFSTNVTSRTYFTNQVAGEYFLTTTGACDTIILAPQLTFTSVFTNVVISLSNSITSTNVVGTNTGTVAFTRQILEFSTNHVFLVQPVLCLTNQLGLRRGIERIQFIRRDFDSLLGQFYFPETNFFSITTITNSTDIPQRYQRVITTPDFLFTGTDLAPGPGADPRYVNVTRSLNFDATRANPGRFGPGTIGAPSQITFNVSGPIFFNQSTNNIFFLDELTAFRRIMWASFDDSTNAPVLYPNGTSLEALENQLTMQVANPVLTSAVVGEAYSTQLQGSGGNSPYIWVLAPNSPDLPPGLALASDGSGRITGVPTSPGIYDFSVLMTDVDGRFATWPVSITVNP